MQMSHHCWRGQIMEDTTVTNRFRRHMHHLMIMALVTGVPSYLQTDVHALGLQSNAKPKVLVIGTGGTIAGVARNPGGATYDPGKLAVDAILSAIPEVNQDIE